MVKKVEKIIQKLKNNLKIKKQKRSPIIKQTNGHGDTEKFNYR